MQISCFSLVTFITTSSNLNKKNVFTEINNNYIMQHLFLIAGFPVSIDSQQKIQWEEKKRNWSTGRTNLRLTLSPPLSESEEKTEQK